MTEFTYEPIPFQVPVREGFYHYRQEVSPAYLVTDTAIDWASIVVHRKPGKADTRWFVSEFVTGGAIPIPDCMSRDAAVHCAVEKLQTLGRDGYQSRLKNFESAIGNFASRHRRN